jgi:hypothetical protein
MNIGSANAAPGAIRFVSNRKNLTLFNHVPRADDYAHHFALDPQFVKVNG